MLVQCASDDVVVGNIEIRELSQMLDYSQPHAPGMCTMCTMCTVSTQQVLPPDLWLGPVCGCSRLDAMLPALLQVPC